MGRSPCCDKVGLKKGPWTPEEDRKLLAYIQEHGHGSWRALPAKAGLERCGKSCRLRWTNYLRPDIKRGKFSGEEEQTIIQLHALLGNRWSAIATHLPKRTDNEIKNYWNTHLKKKLAKMGIDPVTHKPQKDAILTNDGDSTNSAHLSHMAQWESARLEAEARLVTQSKLRAALANSNSIHNPDFASPFGPTGLFQKPVGMGRGLNGLEVWNDGFWGNKSEALGENGDLESPASSLSSVAGIGIGDSGNVKMENEEEWKLLPESRDGIFVENFTDLLLNFPGNQCLSEDHAGESDGGGDCHEENKDYWNSILNLVDSSLSDSPMFTKPNQT